LIELKRVGFAYPETRVLEDLQLSIGEGESVALIGPNGSGKSTLLKLICGLVQASEGAYAFDGKAISTTSLRDPRFAKAFHRRVGFLFQDSDTQLFCGSVYDEIAFGPRQLNLSEEEIGQRVADLLALFGLERLSLRVPYHLSGGEKRKVALASVLALNPDAILLDEPMSGLDPKTKRSLRELILSLNEAGKTILCATHDFEYVKGMFGRAIVLSKEGRVVRDGPYDEVIADRPFLESMNIV
jgi:cobalt/nickel transport system ATP-binding protein